MKVFRVLLQNGHFNGVTVFPLHKNIYASVYQLENTGNKQFLFCPTDIFNLVTWINPIARSDIFSLIISGNEILSSLRF